MLNKVSGTPGRSARTYQRVVSEIKINLNKLGGMAGRNGNGQRTRISGLEGNGSPARYAKYIKLEMDLLKRFYLLDEQEARLGNWENRLTNMQARLMRCLKALEAEKAELEALKAGLDEEAGLLVEDLAGREEELNQREEALLELNALLDAQQAELYRKEDELSEKTRILLAKKEEVDQLVEEYQRRKEKEEGEVRPSSKHGLKIKFVNLSVDNLSGTIELG